MMKIMEHLQGERTGVYMMVSSKSRWMYVFVLLCLLPVPSFSQDYMPGNTYFDDNNYVEYLAGNLPLVISVPHGGYLEPASIPDRECGGCSYVRDAYTQELAREVQAAFFEATGCYPHIIINLLHRKKFDANRSITTAADGNTTVEQSWYAYHDFLDVAKAKITEDYNRGLFLDLHGHGHDIQRIELGYGLSKSDLQLEDSDLNDAEYIAESSVRTLVGDNLQAYTHAELLRGHNSFGSLLDDESFAAVPSSDDPFPLNGEDYFSGGYNTLRHGSLEGGAIDGIQIECNQSIRFNETRRLQFAESLPSVIIHYLDTHYNDQFEGNYCNLVAQFNIPKQDNSFEIYPNPTHHQLQITSDLNVVDVTIYNSLGVSINTLQWTGTPLDVSQLESGLYFLECQYEGLSLGTQVLIRE